MEMNTKAITGILVLVRYLHENTPAPLTIPKHTLHTHKFNLGGWETLNGLDRLGYARSKVLLQICTDSFFFGGVGGRG